uniref:SCP domain-containing protein n=1 Tax=Strongyloides papillosus TaxID=174720 RepID=A0A0N5B1P7_STREA
MIDRILFDNPRKNPPEMCVYNVGFIRGHTLKKTYSKSCDSILSILNSNTRPISYTVKSYNPKHIITYTCKRRHFTNFDKALEYALMMQLYIKFIPSSFKPVPPQKQFCIETKYRKICYMRNPITLALWKSIWQNCNGGCYYKSNFRNARKHYYDEINLYRSFVGCSPVRLYEKLNVMAQTRAEVMAKKNNIMADSNKDYDEVVAFAKFGYGIYLIKMIFDNVFFEKPDFHRLSPSQTDFQRLFSCKQRLIGFGLVKNGFGAYISIKFTDDYW